MQPLKRRQFSPGRIVIFSFLFIIGIGTMLLTLPQSRTVNIPFLDILFTAASSTCVAGLKTIPMDSFTTFGKLVILAMIQLGGLGLMTFSFFFISLFLNLGMTTQILAGKILDFNSWSKIKRFLAIIIGTTFLTESIGAILLYFPLKNLVGPQKAPLYAIFHSVSAFCNSGLDLFNNGLSAFQTQPHVLFYIALLIFSGSIGFFIWYEVANKIKRFFTRKKAERLNFSLHAKITLATTSILIIIGTIATWLLERNGSLQHLAESNRFIVSFCNAISIRSAGFDFFNLAQATYPLLLVFLLLMYVGASSGSTGGGIKITTFALFIATMTSIIRNRKDVEMFGRKIPYDQIYHAIAIVVLSSLWIIIAFFFLLLTETNLSFIEILFETISSFGTCGLSTGITANLSSYGKIVLITTMFIGRVGSLTMVLALSKKKKKSLYQYPEERIIIG